MFDPKVMKARREDLHMTKAEVAHRVGVCRDSISNWENGQNMPGVDSFVRWSAALSIPLSEVLAHPMDTVTFGEVVAADVFRQKETIKNG
ncbi:helix-turn-helix domain-containing protein [Streptomyces endophytica]|uniref:Helix-turn-helix domain-containing protein n=1 Tax=Streptomyces endophytica TaxID=2991496 RepID=A0ABY6P816_9ACTN|nr:helix-turn-helix transcriptional regulator [Streptomyces endophytica]UZJ29362.1 helix-turn-helix domain-containing protein [Streptomyces endophytica]